MNWSDRIAFLYRPIGVYNHAAGDYTLFFGGAGLTSTDNKSLQTSVAVAVAIATKK